MVEANNMVGSIMSGQNVEIEIDIVKRSTGKALLVTLTESGKDVWIPISVIDHDECSITDEGDSGSLVIRKWFAVKEGIVEEDE